MILQFKTFNVLDMTLKVGWTPGISPMALFGKIGKDTMIVLQESAKIDYNISCKGATITWITAQHFSCLDYNIYVRSKLSAQFQEIVNSNAQNFVLINSTHPSEMYTTSEAKLSEKSLTV